MLNHFIAIVVLLLLSAFGFRSLHLFATSNGLLTRLEKCITNGTTPRGKPLRTWTTNGRFPAADIQLRAVATFLMIFCEDLDHPDADVVGFSFAANWGASWMLIVLESLREYSRHRLMSWYDTPWSRVHMNTECGLIVDRITIPGLLIFNQSNAVFTPLYLAVRLAFAAPSHEAKSLTIGTADIQAIPLSFICAYVLPLGAMAMAGTVIRGFNTKHIIASFYQQWNLFISLAHFAFVWYSREAQKSDNLQPSQTLRGPELLIELQPVYKLAMLLAAASLWGPIIVSAGARILGGARREMLSLHSVFVPPLPWTGVQCRSIFEGGKWLLQWDGIIGSLGSAVWAIALYDDVRANLTPLQSSASFSWTIIRYFVIGGTMGVAVGMLWERDALVLA